MKILGIEKGILLRLIVWVIFIIIAIFLLDPRFKAIPASFILLVIQGVIYVISFWAFALLTKRSCPSLFQRHSILIYLLVGFLCGAISSIPNIVISWLGDSEAMKNSVAHAQYGLEKQLKTDLVIYGLWSGIIGTFLGYCVKHRKKIIS